MFLDLLFSKVIPITPPNKTNSEISFIHDGLEKVGFFMIFLDMAIFGIYVKFVVGK